MPDLNALAQAVSRMPRMPKGGARVHIVREPNLGIYLDRGPLDTPDRALLSCLNFRIENGRLSCEGMGWLEFFATYYDPDLQDLGVTTPVLLIQEFRLRTGLHKLVFGTRENLYEFAINTGAIFLNHRYTTGTITKGGTGTTTVTGVGTLFDTAVNGRKNVRAGDYLIQPTVDARIPTPGAGDGWIPIVSVTDDTHFEVPTGFAAFTGVTYTVRQCFDGDDADIWDTQDFPDAQPADSDTMYFTNGIEMCQWDAGAAATEVVNLDLGFAARVLGRRNNIMLYGDLLIGGERKPQSMRSSQIAKPEAVSGGNSVEIAVTNGSDLFVALEELSDFTVAYMDGSINVMEYVGPPVQWIIRTVESRKGAVARRGIVDKGTHHEFLSRDGLYRFNGRDIELVAPQVMREVMRRQFDGERAHTAIGFYHEEESAIQWVIPTASDATAGSVTGSPDFAYTTFPDEYVGQYPVPATFRQLPATAVGSWQREDGAVQGFNLVTDAFEDVTRRWNDRQFAADFPIVIFGDRNGKVYLLGTTNDQDGLPINSRATFPRMPLIDGRQRGLIKRFEPFLDGFAGESSQQLLVVFDLYDSVGAAALAGVRAFFVGGSQPGDPSWTGRFLAVRVSGRYVQTEIRRVSSQAGGLFTCSGYALTISPIGTRDDIPT